MADLYNKAQYIYVAGANKSGSLYGIVPVPGTSNVTLASASSFRTSSGSRTNSNGIIENIAPHILRVDYPDLVTCPSYKFEPQRTNYLYNTDHLSTGSATSLWNLNQAFWSLFSDPTSPAGTGFAGFLRESSSNPASTGFATRQTTTLPTSSQNFTVSVYAKRSGSGADVRNLMIQHGGVGSADANMNTYFILEGTGSIYTGYAPIVKPFVSGAYIEPLPNGWYRCSVIGSSAPVALYARYFVTSGSIPLISYTPNGRAGLYLACAQLESGSAHNPRLSLSTSNMTYVTSYISSSTDTIGTRTADRSVSLPAPAGTTNWTAFAAITRYNPDPGPGAQTNFDFRVNSGSGNFAGTYLNGVPIWNSGSAGNTPSGSSLPMGTEYKCAIRLSGSQMTWFINGARRFSIPWGTTGTWSSVTIGDQDPNTAITHKGSFYTRVAAMFSQSLSDAECISLTTTGSGTSIV